MIFIDSIHRSYPSNISQSGSLANCIIITLFDRWVIAGKGDAKHLFKPGVSKVVIDNIYLTQASHKNPCTTILARKPSHNKQIRPLQYEIDALKSKVGEPNRRAYKIILKKLFDHLKLQVSEDELSRLVKFRNDIIHRGMPRGDSLSESFEDSLQFASLVEKVLLAILDYHGTVEYYHEGIRRV